MSHTQTSVPPPPTTKSKKRTCCAGKKLVTYSCKVWCMVAVCVLLIAAASVLMYVLLSKNSTGQPEKVLALPKKPDWFPECLRELENPLERFNCYPEDRFVGKSACEARGCCYLNLTIPGELIEYGNRTFVSDKMPHCVYPKNYGYVAAGKTTSTFNGFVLPLQRVPAPSRFGDDTQVVNMLVEMQTKHRLRIKFYGPEHYHFEVPTPKIHVQDNGHNGREVFSYSVAYDVHNKISTVKVRRSDTDAIIFDTSVGALSLSYQFLELTTKLASSNVFGFGSKKTVQYNDGFQWETFSMFSSKEKLGVLSGVHPMYMCLEDDGNAYGVLLLNSNALEVELHPLPAITFRTIGGVLDFYLFLGPTPEEVIQQYTAAIGFAFIPPYWSLGLQIKQAPLQSPEEIEKFLNDFKAKHIPVESLILNEDTVLRIGSGVENLNKFSNVISNLKNKSQKLILQLAAGIPKDAVLNRDSAFTSALVRNVFVCNKWGRIPLEGKYKGRPAVYPDFGSPDCINWWSKATKKISSLLEYDGIWLVNNEPLSEIDGSVNGCLDDNFNNPPYVPEALNDALYDRTLCMDALLTWKYDIMPHYDAHNLYGHSMAAATEQALASNFPSERKLILSDSTFTGTGHHAGHYLHIPQNSWEVFRSSISDVLRFQMHGVIMTGIGACENPTQNQENDEELCVRWLQCAIFYPLLQLHYEGTEYLHKSLSNKEVIHSIRNALSRRYELLPQLYTLLHLAHIKGSTVVRPLFHNFPTDIETYSINSQFMWGSSLLISPILEKNATKLDFYLPEGIWFDFYQGNPIYSSGEWFAETSGPFIDSKQPAVLHMRAGHVITLQKPAETTTISRQNSMSILVALNSSLEAHGLLYWDDGETRNSYELGEYLLVEYSAKGNSLNVTGHFGKKVLKSSFYKGAIEQVRIMGLSKPPKRIIIDGSYILSNKQYHWNYDTMVLDLKLILIPLGRKTELQWQF